MAKNKQSVLIMERSTFVGSEVKFGDRYLPGTNSLRGLIIEIPFYTNCVIFKDEDTIYLRSCSNNLTVLVLRTWQVKAKPGITCVRGLVLKEHKATTKKGSK
jgi:hypothetical protein